jgi:hypothetical protein
LEAQQVNIKMSDPTDASSNREHSKCLEESESFSPEKRDNVDLRLQLLLSLHPTTSLLVILLLLLQLLLLPLRTTRRQSSMFLMPCLLYPLHLLGMGTALGMHHQVACIVVCYTHFIIPQRRDREFARQEAFHALLLRKGDYYSYSY